MNTALRILRTWAKLRVGRHVWKSYGQSGEDALVRALLSPVKKGFYVDVGAFDPVLYSNTYRFYKVGWNGVVVDPNSDLKPLFQVFRPRDTFVLSAVGKATSELTYYKFRDGAYNSLDRQQVAALAARQNIHAISSATIQVRTLTEIVDAAGLKHIDFLNVDVEGMDEEVLTSYDWKVRPKVVAAEDMEFDPLKPHESRICNLMLSRNYRVAGFTGLCIIFADRL